MPISPTTLIKRLLRRATLTMASILVAGRRTLARQLGIKKPLAICAYRGFATGHRILVSGRVFANRPVTGATETDGTWRNLVSTWQRWNSVEVPGARVILTHGEAEVAVTCGGDGFYRASLPFEDVRATSLEWLNVEARTTGWRGEIVTAVHPVLVPGAAAEFGVISDLDDTVIHTGITNLFLAAKLTFLGNARTRKPLEGVAELYRAFRNGRAGGPVNPIFYISSSAWNLYDLLSDFLALNEIPAGPLILRDFTVELAIIFHRRDHRHKLERTLEVMAAFPHLPFVLVGDSGQQDAELYAEAATLRPSQIKAIYIRDIDPDSATARDENVDRMIAIARAAGVPMLLAPDSHAMARHAVSIGLIPAAEIEDVAASVERDRHRPTEAEQALAQTFHASPPDQPD
ncbi:MAG: phosphatase domain-containing protein [Chthoniobacteraceae bacterium]